MRRFLSSILAAALILLSPGLPAYAALAGRVTAARVNGTKIQAAGVRHTGIPDLSKIPQLGARVPGIAPNVGLQSGKAQGSAAQAPQAGGLGFAAQKISGLKDNAHISSLADPNKPGKAETLSQLYDQAGEKKPSDADGVAGKASSSSNGGLTPSTGKANLVKPEPPQEPGKPEDSAPKGALDKLKAAWAEIKALPPAFRVNYVMGWTINSFGQEFPSVALPLFTAAAFDLPTALLISGIGYAARIPGAWTGSFFMNHFHPNHVNLVSIVAVAAGAAAIALAGPANPFLFSILVANSVIGGLAYGVTRGIVESTFPKLIMGGVAQDAPEEVKKAKQKQIELGLNYATQWVEIGCIVADLWVANLLLKLVGGQWMMGLSAVMTMIGAGFYATTKFAVKWEKPKAPAAGQDGGAKQEENVPLKEMLPVFFNLIYSRFNHFAIYGVVSTVLALAVFTSDAAGHVLGIYSAGSWLLSLLASLALLPKNLGPKAWSTMTVMAAAAFLFSPILHSVILTTALAGILGGVITINSNKWGAIAQQKLPERQLKNLSTWVMTLSILALLPIFGAVSAIRLYPAVAEVLSMSKLLMGVAALDTAAGLFMLWLLRGDSKK